MYKATTEELAALDAAASFWGSGWKSRLQNSWLYSSYPASLNPYKSALQGLRNKTSSEWLRKFQFEK
jgi:hypothetical protein